VREGLLFLSPIYLGKAARIMGLAFALLTLGACATLTPFKTSAPVNPETQAPVYIGLQTSLGQNCYRFDNGLMPIYSCVENLHFNSSVLAKRDGSCEIVFNIDKQGRVSGVRVLSAIPAEGRVVGACRKAPHFWRFTPPKLEDKQATSLQGIYAKISVGSDKDKFALRREWNKTANVNLKVDDEKMDEIIQMLERLNDQ
jgi:hypothetical protein